MRTMRSRGVSARSELTWSLPPWRPTGWALLGVLAVGVVDAAEVVDVVVVVVVGGRAGGVAVASV